MDDATLVTEPVAAMPIDDVQSPEGDPALNAPESELETGAALRITPTDPNEICTEQIIEALLFASDAPLPPRRLAELAGADSVRDVRACVETLNDRYGQAGMTFRIEELAGGYQMLSLPAFGPWLAKLDRDRGQSRISDAAMETLSIIAYRQPIIRADVEAVRGVACGEVLNRLREMGLVKIVGRAEVVGRPLLYGTTKKFLDVFGLGRLEDLPPMEALAIKARVESPSPTDQEPPEPARKAAGA